MQFLKFFFHFLYARNWYTGEMELSRPRVVLFAAMLSLILLGFLIASILQTPVGYSTY